MRGNVASSRQGFLIYVTVFSILVVSVLALQFLSFSRHAQFSANRLETADIARQVAWAAMDEAFLKLWEGTRDPVHGADSVGNDTSRPDWSAAWFLQQPAEPLKIENLETGRIFTQWLEGAIECETEAFARHFEKRRNGYDDAGTVYRYHDKEGNGNIELVVQVTLRRAGKILFRSKFLRHHEYLVTCIVSERNNQGPRESYHQNYPLDYALLTRSPTDAGTLNCGARVLVRQPAADPGQWGKVFLAGTETPENTLFLNIGPEYQALIPQAAIQGPGGNQGPLVTVTGSDALRDPDDERLRGFYDFLRAMPDPPDSIRQASFQQFKDRGLPGMSFQVTVSGLPFTGGTFPDRPSEDSFKSAFWGLPTGSVDQAFMPGLRILGDTADPAAVSQILEGFLKQRFHYCSIWEAEQKKFPGAAKPHETMVDDGDPNIGKLRKLAEFQEFLGEMHPAPTNLPIVSSFTTAFLLNGSPAARPEGVLVPTFFRHQDDGRTAGPIAQSIPYRLRMLYSRKVFGIPQAGGNYDATPNLIKCGIYDPGAKTLNLAGIVTAEAGDSLAELTLGDGSGDITVRGSGVLIADVITIKSGIKKAGDLNLCMLFANKIRIQTGQPIEAALLAFNSAGIFAPAAQAGIVEISAGVQAKIKGCLGVEKLSLTPQHDVEVTYDPVLKSPVPGEEIFQIDLARQLTFQRYFVDRGEAS